MSVGRRLLLGTAALVALRLLLSAGRPGPVILVDEIGYLTNARVLAGGVPAELLTTPFYHGGYSLLIAPLVALFDDPVTVYRLALVVNALLAAALFPLLYLLLTRGFRVAPRLALWPALAAAAYPAVTPTTGAAMSENLLFPLTAAWLLAFARLLDSRAGRAQPAWAGAFGFAAALLWATHGRMVVAVVLTAGALLVLGVRRRLALSGVVAGGGALAVGLLGARALNTHLVEENYGGRDLDEARTRLEAISNLDDLVTIGGNLVGQTWYLLVATLGLGLVLLLPRARRGLLRTARGRAGTTAALLVMLLLTTLGLIAVSALSFPDIERPDQLVYGRYVEVVAPPLIALGLVAIALGRGSGLVRPVVAILLGTSTVVAVLRTGLHAPATPSFWNVMSLPVRTDGLGAASLFAAGVAACACAAALLWLARRRPELLAPLVLLMLVPTTAFAERQLLQRSATVYPSGWASIGDALSGRGVDRIAFDRRRATFDGQFIYPWFAKDAVVVSSTRAVPAERFVVSSEGWSREHPTLGATAIWKDPARDQALWRIAPPHREARAIQSCLRSAGVPTAPAGEDPRGAATLTLVPRAARPGRLMVFSTRVAASVYAAQVRRLVEAADPGGRTAVALREHAVVVAPEGLARSPGESLLRCL
jgi:hypothetical protein